jgi:hypothetical protein
VPNQYWSIKYNSMIEVFGNTDYITIFNSWQHDVHWPMTKQSCDQLTSSCHDYKK